MERVHRPDNGSNTGINRGNGAGWGTGGAMELVWDRDAIDAEWHEWMMRDWDKTIYPEAICGTFPDQDTDNTE